MSRYGKLQGLDEREIQALGFSFRPVQGRDRRKRIVPFTWVLEGARLFTYAENLANPQQGIQVRPYEDSARVAREGASIPVLVPSRTAKQPRYRLKLSHVPVVDNPEKNAIVWSFGSTYEEGRESEHSRFNIRYTYEQQAEGSDVHFIYPQDVTALLGVAKHFWRENKNRVPWDMNPCPKPSQLEAELFTKMKNQALIVNSQTKKLRKLYVPEVSLLLARTVGVLGHDATMFWNPERDPASLKDYNWRY